MERLTPKESSLLLMVLRKHDGATLMPDLPFTQQVELSRMLDKLRRVLVTLAEQGGNDDSN